MCSVVWCNAACFISMLRHSVLYCVVAYSAVGTVVMWWFSPQEDCNWTIIAPDGYSVRLMFRTFEIEHETECNYDYVEVFDGEDYAAPNVGKYCGHKVSPG